MSEFGAPDLEVMAPHADTVVPSAIFQFGSTATATATALLVTLGLSLLMMWRKRAVMKVLSKNEEAEELFFDVSSYEQYAEQRKQDLKPGKKD